MNCHLNLVRWALPGLGHTDPHLLDVQHYQWVYDPSGLRTVKQNHLSLPEQVGRWNALVDVEGLGNSGRLELLLHSGRPVLVEDRPWREWYWDSLVPMEHYIPVRRDLSDVVDQARWVQQNQQEAEQIGRPGQRLAQRLLTRTSAVSEWGRTLSVVGQNGTEGWAPQALLDDLSSVLRGLGAPRLSTAVTRTRDSPGAPHAGDGPRRRPLGELAVVDAVLAAGADTTVEEVGEWAPELGRSTLLPPARGGCRRPGVAARRES